MMRKSMMIAAGLGAVLALAAARAQADEGSDPANRSPTASQPVGAAGEVAAGRGDSNRPAGLTEGEYIARLVRQLGSDSWQVRDSATRQLIRIGRGALPAVRAALTDKDLEVVVRARAVIAEILGLVRTGAAPLRAEMGAAFAKADYRTMVDKARLVVELADSAPMLDWLWLGHAGQLSGDWPQAVDAYQHVISQLDTDLASGIKGFGTPRRNRLGADEADPEVKPILYTPQERKELLNKQILLATWVAKFQSVEMKEPNAAVKTLLSAVASLEGSETEVDRIWTNTLRQAVGLQLSGGDLAGAAQTCRKLQKADPVGESAQRVDIAALAHAIAAWPADKPLPDIPYVHGRWMMRKSTIYAAFAAGLGMVLALAAARAWADGGSERATQPETRPTTKEIGDKGKDNDKVADGAAKERDVRMRLAKGSLAPRNDAAAANAKARERFLAIERIARLPAADQAKVVPILYRNCAHCYPSVKMILMSFPPSNILDRKSRKGSGGNTEKWAEQIAEAASKMTAEQIADKLGDVTWLDIAAHARAIWVLKANAAVVEPLIEADLKSGRDAQVKRAVSAIRAMKLKKYNAQMLAIFLAGGEASESARQGIFSDDPAVVQALLTRAESDPKFLGKCAGMLQVALWHKPAEPVLLKLLNSPDAKVRYDAADAAYDCVDANLAPAAKRFAKEAKSANARAGSSA